jgi:hypothetical protein
MTSSLFLLALLASLALAQLEKIPQCGVRYKLLLGVNPFNCQYC